LKPSSRANRSQPAQGRKLPRRGGEIYLFALEDDLALDSAMDGLRVAGVRVLRVSGLVFLRIGRVFKFRV
jgi:hypothetical protein